MSLRPRANLRRKLLLSLGVFAASVIACELGLRVVLRIQGRPYSAWHTREEVERAVDTTRAFVPAAAPDPNRPNGSEGPVLNPYAGAEAWHDTGGVLEYYRNQARSDDFKVLVVGGSVAASFARTLQKELPELLRDVPALAGKHVTVQNYAHAAYKQPQQVTRLVYLLSFGYRPDAVIDIDGFNEVAFGLENAKSGTNPVYPTAPVWGAVANDFGADVVQQAEVLWRMQTLRARARSIAATAARWHLYESSWLGRWTLSRISAANADFLLLQRRLLSRASTDERMRRQLQGPDFDAGDDALMSTCVQCWVEGSMSLQDLCASRGIRFVHVLQPTLHDTGSKPISPAEEALPLPSPNWLTGARVGYPLLRARIPELRAHGVHLVDSSRIFADVQQPLYFDACHLNQEGERMWYVRLAPELREALVGQ